MGEPESGRPLPCRGCGVPVWVPWAEPVVHGLERRAGKTSRSVSVRCAACDRAADDRLRAEFPWLFPEGS